MGSLAASYELDLRDLCHLTGPLKARWEDTQHQVGVVRPWAFGCALGADWEGQPRAAGCSPHVPCTASCSSHTGASNLVL